MKILTLRLENFQGLRDAFFDFDGQSASVYGNNGAGKTTVFNAVTWLLYGRASTDASGFTPKTRGGPDGYLHHLNHGVCAEFLTGSGETVTLEKVFHEVYKKKRGSAREEFSGHTIDYFLNGVPVKEKEYAAAVLAFCGQDREKQEILTKPAYFSEKLHWKRRREILLAVCGAVSDAEVIARTPELAGLPAFLRMPGSESGSYSIEEYRKIAAASRKKINQELDSIPERIDEASKAIPDAVDRDMDAIEREIAALKTRIADLNAERASASMGGDSAERATREAVANLQAQMAEGRAGYVREQAGANASIEAEIQAARSEAASHRRAKEDAELDLAREREKRERLSRRREEIRAEYKAVFAERWNPASELCPTCGQALPAEKVERMRSDFNLRRSNRLTETERRGQREASRSMIAERDAKIAELEQTIAAEDKAMSDLDSQIRELQAQLVPALPYEMTTEYASLNRQITVLRERLNRKENAVSAAAADFDGQIRAAGDALNLALENRSKLETARQQRERIAELEAREKELSAEFERTEQGLYLCDEFTKAKVSMLTERINEKFRRLRFQLFSEQINGGVEECCEVLIPNDAGVPVPWQDANNAAKINAGLEIIGTLSRYWDMTMPVFVDNAESVQNTESVSTQLIRLVVPPSWESLSKLARDALIRAYGSESAARTAYETENQRLRLEIRRAEKPDEKAA